MENSDFYLSVINHLDEGIYYVDKTRKILFFNKAAEEISGYTKEEMNGKHCNECGLNHIDLYGRGLCNLACPLSKTLVDGKDRCEKVLLRHKSGKRILIQIKVFPIYDDNSIIGAVEIFKKINEQTYQDDVLDSISKLALTDTLTNLPNRRMGESFLNNKINEYKRTSNKFGLIYMDIDDFSNINNTYGHDIGDKVLKEVTKVLNNNIRATDLVSRWGGEEFVGIYKVNSLTELAIIAERLRKLISEIKVKENDRIVEVTISLGATMFNELDSFDSLVKRADMLLYESKTSGKNKVSCK